MGYLSGATAQGIVLQKIDNNGLVLLTKELSTTYPLEGKAITKMTTGFALIGRPSQSQYKDLLILTNENLEPIEAFQLSLTTGEFRINSICYNEAANAIYVSGNGLTNAPLSLHKISPAGNVIWSKTLIQGGTAAATLLKTTTDGNLFLAGNTDLANTGDENMFVAKLDTAGNILWSKVADIAKFESISGIVELDNQAGFMVIGSFKTGLAAVSQAFLWKIAANGTPEKMLHIGGDSKFGNAITKLEYNHTLLGISGTFSGIFGSRMVTAVASPEGEIMWSKRTASNTLNSGINALHTDNNGAVHMSYYLGYSIIDPRFNQFNCQFEDYIPDTLTLAPSYNSLIGSPFFYPVNSQTISLNTNLLNFSSALICDTTVNSISTQTQEIVPVSSKIITYPNPFYNFIQVDFSALDSKEPIEFYLYSASGMCIRKGALKSDRLSIDTSELPEGVYLFKAYQNGKNVDFQKIIKQ